VLIGTANFQLANIGQIVHTGFSHHPLPPIPFYIAFLFLERRELRQNCQFLNPDKEKYLEKLFMSFQLSFFCLMCKIFVESFY
jgi:hypothetical protein